MASIARVAVVTAVVLAGALASGCDTLDNLQLWDTKKKLEGDRKPVFPDGVPGVNPGVPPELMKGYREPTAEETPPAIAAAVAAKPEEAQAKPKPRPKPKPQQTASKPPPQPAAQSAAQPANAAPQPGATAPWPSNAPQAAAPAAPQAAWPGSSGGTVAR